MAARYNKQWEVKNPEKNTAHRRVEYALRSGSLKKAVCVICGAENTHAHHEDYSKPLRVIWLCPQHHMARHSELRAGAAEDWSHHEVEARSDIQASGQRYLTWNKREGLWEVRIRRRSLSVRKAFKDLEKALRFRDQSLAHV